MEGPFLEEFIPIKKRASLDFDDEDEQHSHKSKVSKDNNKNIIDKRKSDWLRSVQLRNPNLLPEEDVSREVFVTEVKRSGSGGAFHPFHKDEKVGKTIESLCKSLSSMPVVAASSTVVTVAKDNAKSSKKEEKDGDRKQRRCWSPALHNCFLKALQQLGGANSATLKQIRELMKVDGLTNDEVNSCDHYYDTYRNACTASLTSSDSFAFKLPCFIILHTYHHNFHWLLNLKMLHKFYNPNCCRKFCNILLSHFCWI